MLQISFLLTVAILGTLLFRLDKTLKETRRDRDRARQDLLGYESLTSREETERKLDSNIQLKEDELQALDVRHKNLQASVKSLQSRLNELETKEYLISIDEYEPKYDLESSGDYLKRLAKVRSEQKKMLKSNQAFPCNANLTIGEGAKRKTEGKQMIKNLQKMMKMAFEEPCKYAIKEAKYNNLEKLRQRIYRTFDRINGYMTPINGRVSDEYLKLKLIELDLKYECEEKKQEERERKREIREQMKREAKERREIEKAQQEAEEAEERTRQYEEEIERIRLEEQEAAGLHREEYERKIADLQEKLSQAKIDRDKAIDRSKKIKSGYIYVISNIGSLGRDIYRILMTKNSSPDQYIGSMKPYVPFPFDIHFKIFSEDASETINYLHQKFSDSRVNIKNERREFFKLSLDEIGKVVQEIKRETGIVRVDKFEPNPQAYEYRQTLAARRRDQHLGFEDVYVGENETA